MLCRTNTHRSEDNGWSGEHWNGEGYVNDEDLNSVSEYSLEEIEFEVDSITKNYREYMQGICEGDYEIYFHNPPDITQYNYIKSTINKCSIPTVQLLMRDHKDRNKNGEFPSRSVVPAKNFTAAFPHVAQRGNRQILDRNHINYSKKNIIQASDLKEQLEKLTILKSKNTIMSIDAENMYPSVNCEQIKRAVDHFLSDTSEEDKATAKRCLEMVK